MDAARAFPQANALTPPAFVSTGRYCGVPTAQASLPDVCTVADATRRILPASAVTLRSASCGE
jgi:hypothetical protein